MKKNKKKTRILTSYFAVLIEVVVYRTPVSSNFRVGFICELLFIN